MSRLIEVINKTKKGTVEIDDQVKGLDYAVRTFDCIDTQRVGIFGWSYGGYMALMGIAQRPDVFKVT
jgi:dipeptidyl aminopeptidase/acylaminoacyl peptidase